MGSIFSGPPKPDTSAQDAAIAREKDRADKLDAEKAASDTTRKARRQGRALLISGDETGVQSGADPLAARRGSV
jgi:hypothetical protein